jgi:hypothetical protein
METHSFKKKCAKLKYVFDVFNVNLAETWNNLLLKYTKSCLNMVRLLNSMYVSFILHCVEVSYLNMVRSILD